MRLLLALFLLSAWSVSAQNITIKRINTPIQLDGILDEAVWQELDKAEGFHQYFPMDTSKAVAQTEVRLAYDDKFIYVGARMQNLGATRKYVTPSLRRDFRGEANDGFTVVFDTFLDRTNAFVFGINPFGVQREGLIANGGGVGSDDFTLNWDNKWYGEAKIHEGYWTAEMKIPFTTLRYKKDISSWNINFYRIDSEYAERSTWAPIPRNFDIVNLASIHEVKWDQPLAKPGPNISLIPYLAANSNKNFLEGTSAREFQAGMDAKIGIGPALNLDLTINPDFSQVEVDQQVTNLDRFEIFFPERRQFFLENADLFAGFGMGGTRPFFSRRIGVARDTATGQNIENPIYAGARLSGKLDNKTRLGVLVTQAGEERDIGLPSINYTVAAVQRKVFARSNVGFILVNKQAFQDSIGGDFNTSPEAFNRLAGVDYNLASADNKWNGKLFYHQSFERNNPSKTYAAGMFLSYSTYRWELYVTSRDVGANYNPEVGFVRRRDIRQLASTLFYNIYPKKGSIQRHGPGFDFDMVGNSTYGFLDWDYNFMYNIQWKNTANFSMRLRQQYTYLFDGFDPSGTSGLELPAGTEYTNNVFIAEFNSDARKKFSYNIGTRSGQYFNGTRWNLEGTLTYRYQPYGFISVDFAWNKIDMPKPYNSTTLWLIAPRVDLTLSRSVFWTTFFQYNSQIENLNINSRLQWRFKPVSDLFLVYTDNYFADTSNDLLFIGRPKARAISLKVTYWLNL